MALLALLQADWVAGDRALAQAIHSGVAHLLEMQAPDGRFGEPTSGMDYTHYLAAKALEAASRRADAPVAWSGFSVQTTERYYYGDYGQLLKTTLEANGIVQKVTQYSYDADRRKVCIAVRQSTMPVASALWHTSVA